MPGFTRVFNGMTKGVHKEFMREYKATMKLLNSQDAFNELYKYAQRVHPELYEKKNQGLVTKTFKEDKKQVDKYFKGWDKDVDPEKMAKILGIWTPKAAKLGGQAAINKLGFKLVFNLKDPALIKELTSRGVKITGNISERTLEDFQRVLLTSYMEEGISPYEVKQRIKGMFEETYRNRAMAIARTETGIASSLAQHKTYEMNDIAKKEWLAVMDDRTRESHARTNGQIVPIDEPFDVMGTPMMHPLDPSAPAAEVVNCRCDELPVIEQKLKDEEVWTGGED